MKNYTVNTIYVRLTDGPYPDESPEQRIGALLEGKYNSTFSKDSFVYNYNVSSTRSWAMTKLSSINCREANEKEIMLFKKGYMSIYNKLDSEPEDNNYLEQIIS